MSGRQTEVSRKHWEYWALIACSPSFLGLAAVLFTIFFRSYQESQRAACWEQVPARIESVELLVHTGSKGGESYSLRARYSFDRDGGRCSSTRVSLEADCAGNSRELERYELLERHRLSGKPFLAWVNPADPEESLLFRDLLPGSWWLVGIGAFLCGLGVLSITTGIQGLAEVRRQRRTAAPQG